MGQAAVGPAAAGVHTGVVRGRVFGCNIKCLAQENVKRSRRQTKRNERVAWTDRRKGKKFRPCAPSGASRRIRDFETPKRFACVFRRNGCGCHARAFCKVEGRIRPCRLVDTCHNGTPREPFPRVRSDTSVAVWATRPNRRLPVQRLPRTALPPRSHGAGNSKKSTLRNAESAFHGTESNLFGQG